MKKFLSTASAAAIVLASGFAASGASAETTPAPAPAPVQTAAAHDLAPHFTVSGAKSPGFAGLVALRVKNVGTKSYYGEFPLVAFKVEVKAASGPLDVDRLNTPGWFNGAHTEDYGYDAASGTRTFIVTLANPIKAGDDVLVANFNFGDGNTSDGRIVNYMKVTQIGRLADDTSTANDQDVDSRKATTNDFGKPHAGLF